MSYIMFIIDMFSLRFITFAMWSVLQFQLIPVTFDVYLKLIRLIFTECEKFYFTVSMLKKISCINVNVMSYKCGRPFNYVDLS